MKYMCVYISRPTSKIDLGPKHIHKPNNVYVLSIYRPKVPLICINSWGGLCDTSTAEAIRTATAGLMIVSSEVAHNRWNVMDECFTDDY